MFFWEEHTDATTMEMTKIMPLHEGNVMNQMKKKKHCHANELTTSIA
jgi:hypothetical protein